MHSGRFQIVRPKAKGTDGGRGVALGDAGLARRAVLEQEVVGRSVIGEGGGRTSS